MTYSEKLLDPRWQKKRLKVLDRDDFTCCLCQDKSTTLHVHHDKYKGEPWDAPLEVLKTLCAHCHAVETSISGYKLIKVAKTKLNNPSLTHRLICLFKDESDRRFIITAEYNKITKSAAVLDLLIEEDIEIMSSLIALGNGKDTNYKT